ncbi:hypothetical protein LAG90_14095 [Marinilongibacter aquaticus]|uniref:hypothetical protein n=1 Tax=Marinilongibacter aquaticus TaxID=2975157 RepID=UPI0021BD3659|nr:hypothetical protein [Marinilongibacter aquaticus]UBM57936.1 hypothetical protein LAG90_14095 [Marinilongibacter aquaticus]
MSSAFGQSAFVPYGQDYYHLVDRFGIQAGHLSNSFHDNVKPFERKYIAEFIDEVSHDSLSFSKVDSFNISYLKRDSWEFDSTLKETEKPLFKVFFKQPADFYFAKGDDYDVHISPMVNFTWGKDYADGSFEKQFINTRGVELRGRIGKRLAFFSQFTENQRSSPEFLKEYAYQQKGNPYYGFTKIVDEDSVKYKMDYMNALGYLVFSPSKHVVLRFGHSKNFIGSGIRSMILSDFSSPYFNFSANIRLGRLEYMNIMAKMNNRQEEVSIANLVPIPPKFMAFHHLNVNVAKNLNVGLFEMVMFGDRKFDLNYMNPVIFYRFVEGLVGSSDNALVGADFKWNLFKHISLYGQLVLDEFNAKEEKKNGWYGQKNAGQLGMKYINFLGIRQLDAQVEYNYARPYTYSHYNSYSNLLNYNLPLAHPLGANFKETISVLRFQPFGRLQFKTTWMLATKGLDDGSGFNYGGDIGKNYRENRPQDENVEIGQGLKTKINLWKMQLTYMPWHNIFVDFSFQNRMQSFDNPDLNKNTSLFMFGLRWNIFRPDFLF